MNKAVNVNDKLTKRLVLYILFCSIFVSVCSTMAQLYSTFQYDLTLLEQRFKNIEKSHIPSIATSMWDYNQTLVAQQAEGIVNLPDIGFVVIENDLQEKQQFGNENIIPTKIEEYPIQIDGNDIGKIYVYANYEDIYKRLRQQAGFIILSEFVKIFIIAFFIIVVVDKLIIKHLFRITDYAQKLASVNLDEKLTLVNRPEKEDELDYLVSAINCMRVKLQDEIEKLEGAENALLALNGELEVKVHDRTAKLKESNQQLQNSFDNLTLAQEQLVQSEKMASLGQLVAGVAHEVNTPLGICVTSTSALKEKILTLQTAIESQELTKSFLTDTLNLLLEYEKIIERSLQKSVELIRSFKSVAVEQHTDSEVNIDLQQHVKDVVNTVKTLFKQKKYQINIDVDKNISVLTYPSAWNQILTNFLMNSHLHGFEDRLKGEITIEFSESNGYLTLLYSDNGKGIPEKLKKSIFDPFVTTKRGQGGTGLGLNIVYNLVAKLKGKIKLLDKEQGVCFQVKVPITHENRL